MYKEIKKETDHEDLRKKQTGKIQKKQNILNNPINFKKNTTSKLITRVNSNIFPKNTKDNKEIQTNNYTNYNLFAIGYLNDPFNKKEEYPIQKTFTEFDKNQQIKDHSNIIYRNQKEIMNNTTSFFNKTYNKKNQINDFNLPNLMEVKKKKLIKRNIKSKKGSEFPPTGGGNNEFIKRSRSNLINKKHKNFFNNPINRYLSSRIYPNLKKKKQNVKSVFPNHKKNINSNRCVSPSTTNNSNLNSNNNSSNINFKKSFASNMFPKKAKNNINEINGNNIKNNIQDIKMTAIEYQLNQLLARKEKEKEKTKNKYNENEKDNEAINMEELYSKYLDEKAQKLSLVEMEKEKDDTIHSNKKYNNASQKVDYLINKNNYINNFINANKNNNKKINSGINEDLSYNLWLSKNIDYNKNKNKIFSNPIIRYAFFDKMIHNITRKVSIVNKSSEKEFELNISGNLNEKNDKTDNNINQKCQKNKICKDFKTYGYELMPEKVLTNKKENNKEVNIKTNKIEKKSEEKKEQQMKNPNSIFFMNGKNKSTLHKNKFNKKNNIEESKSITKENVRNILNGDKKNKNKAYCLIDNNLSNILNRNDNKLKFSFTYTNGNTSQNYDYLDCLGDSSRRNKLDWNLISESDKEQGRILWKKLTANTPSIFNKKSNNNNTIIKKQINTNKISNILKYPKVKEEILNIIKNKSCKEIKLKENKKDDSKRQRLYCKRRNSSMIFQNIKNLKLFNGLKDINISEDEDEEEDEEEESEDSEDSEDNEDNEDKDKDKDKDKGKDDNNKKNKSKGISKNNNRNINHKVNNYEKEPKIKIRKQKRYETHRLDKKNFKKFEKEKGFENIDLLIEKEEEELDLKEKDKDEDKETINEYEEEKIIKEVTEEKESKNFCQDENKLSKNKNKNNNINKSISRYNKTNNKKENKRNKFINLTKNKDDNDNDNDNEKKEIKLNINLYSAIFHKQNNHRNKLKNQDLVGLSEYVHSSSSNQSSKNIKKSRYKVKVNHFIEIKSKDKNNKFEIKNELYKGIDDKNKSKISNNKKQSLIIEDNQILDDLIPDEFKDENELIVFSPNYSKKEILCLSEDNSKSKRWEIYKKHILESSLPSSSHVIKEVNQLDLFDNFFKNYKSKHYKDDEDEKMNKYYDEIYNKYGKINPKNLVNIKIFGLEFKISVKAHRNFYKNFMKNVRFQNIKRRDERNINKRLSFLLDKYKLQNLNEKNNIILKQRKSKITNIGIKKYFRQNTNSNDGTEKKQVDGDTKAAYQTEITKNDNSEESKVDPKKEMQKKKNELLLKLKHDVKYKIHLGEMKDNEMDNFNKFKKKINEIALEGNNIELYISQLEQRFHSYEKELKLKEEKRDEESRINSFIDSMNYDFQIKNQIKYIQEKNFCNAVDFKQKNIINILSPVQANNKKRFSKYQDYNK